MATATVTRIETRSDEEIQRDVLAELRWQPRVQPNGVGVIVKDGIVTVTGWVDSYLKKWAAEEAAYRVRGVKAVNEVEVRLPSSAERPDADIAAAVRALPLDTLDVTVSKGWVTVRGEVEWHFQKEDAERAVRRLSGVRGVTNLIVVTPRLITTELKEKIEQAPIRSAERDAQQITVEPQGARSPSRVQSDPRQRRKRRSAPPSPHRESPR
jgi:osmotically-inducible protein OsmY